MSKKGIIVLLGLSLLAFLGWMGVSSMNTLTEKKAKEKASENLQSMFKSLNIEVEAKEGKTLLMYFNSECDHCKWEVKQLSENINQFSGVNIALVSLEEADNTRQFLAKHSLEQYFIQTRPEDIMATFSGGVPQLFIYEGNELKKKFKGEVKMNVLLEAIGKK